MIRKSTININYANTGKLCEIDSVIHEYNRIVNAFIDYLWENGIMSGSFVKDTKWLETWLTARMKQAAAKQALAVVRSQRKKQKKTKPVFCQLVMELDSRFIEIHQDLNSFDFWIKLSSLGKGIILWIPSKKHKHFNKFVKAGWKMKKSVRVRKTGSKFFIDIYFEKKEPEKKPFGRVKSVDIGYKKLMVDNRGKEYGKDFYKIAEKISRKKQGSKAFRRALTERDNLINQTVSRFSLSGVRTLVIEDLKNVKHKSKGKLRKSFNNKLQRWSYPKVMTKAAGMCEEGGVRLVRINPAYTSQTCHMCGVRDKSARNGEIFVCKNPACYNFQKKTDADWNGAVNILRKGLAILGMHRGYKTRTVLCQDNSVEPAVEVP